MTQLSKMEETVLNFIKKEADSDGTYRMEFEEMQAVVQMIYATYNKVNQLYSSMRRMEYEKNSCAIGSSHPFL